MLDGHFVSSPAAASQLAVQAFLRTMALVLPCSWTCRSPQKGFKPRSIFLPELASLLWIYVDSRALLSQLQGLAWPCCLLQRLGLVVLACRWPCCLILFISSVLTDTTSPTLVVSLELSMPVVVLVPTTKNMSRSKLTHQVSSIESLPMS